MLKDLFEKQQQYINHFFKHIDIAQAETVLEACLQCKGLILFSGVGKSGIIAEKIAMTLTSTGTKALFLPPSNILHGDIGIVGPQDLFILISKSGETEELLNLIPFIRRRSARIVGIVSSEKSRLVKESDLHICLPLEKELCPFDMAPTTSTEIQLIFGDVLAVGLMQAKKFSLDDYAKTHPSGSIGKKMTLRVEDLMKTGEEIPLCHPSDRLVDILVELSNKKCGCVLVIDKERHMQGIFTDGDLRRALQRQGSEVLEKKMETLMNSTAIVLRKDMLVWDAVKIMQKDPKKWIMVCPVLENGIVVGVIRMHDIIQAGVA
jgi:arabinose-5-phosphate isomerase